MGKKLIQKNVGGAPTPNKDTVSKIGEVAVGVEGPSYEKLRENMRKPNKEGKIEAPDDLNIPYASRLKLEEAKKRDAAKEKKLVPKNKKGGKNWIKGAVNPAHKGYCTPMTKSTCTPRRKAFAMTMKKHHGFHKKRDGGELGDTVPMSRNGGTVLIPRGQQGIVAGANNGFVSRWANAQPEWSLSRGRVTGYGDKNYYNKLRQRTDEQLKREHFDQGMQKARNLAGNLVIGASAIAPALLPSMVIPGAIGTAMGGAFGIGGGLTGMVPGGWIKGDRKPERAPIPQLSYPENTSTPTDSKAFVKSLIGKK